MHVHMKKKNKELFLALLIMVCISSLFLLGKIDEKKNFVTAEKQATDIVGEITKELELTQVFPCEENALEQIQVLLATFARTNHSIIQFALSDVNGNVIQEWKTDAARLKDSSFYTLKLDRKLTNCKGKKYSLHITSDAEAGNGITAYKSIEPGASGLALNGDEVPDSSLCYKLSYRIPFPATARPHLIRFVILIVTGLMVWALAHVGLDRKKEALLAEPGKGSISEIDISGRAISKRDICEGNKSNRGRRRIIEKRLAGDKTIIYFFIIWCVLTLLYAISNPILNVPDEGGHFMRIYEISEGHFISETSEFSNSGGRELPFIQLEDGRDMFDINSFLDQSSIKKAEISNKRIYYIFTNTALYSPLTYIPQVIGVTIARLFTKNLYMIILSGRIINWLCITILLYYTLKLLPYGKEFFMMAVLLPMNLFESFSLSPDGTVVALTAFLIAFVLNIRCNRICLGIRHYVIIYIVAIIMCSIKIVYVPFLLYYFLIPAESFRGGLKGKILHSCICAVIVGIISLGWMGICSRFLLMPGTNSELQMSWVIAHPLAYGSMILRYLFEDGGAKVMECIGYILGKRNILIPLTFVLPYYSAIVIQYWKAGTKEIHVTGEKASMISGGIDMKDAGRRYERCISFLVCIIVTLLTVTALYIQWNEPYATTLEGLQGRYFIPLLLPLYLLVLRNRAKKEEHFRISSQCCSILVNICACAYMLFANL